MKAARSVRPLTAAANVNKNADCRFQDSCAIRYIIAHFFLSLPLEYHTPYYDEK